MDGPAREGGDDVVPGLGGTGSTALVACRTPVRLALQKRRPL